MKLDELKAENEASEQIIEPKVEPEIDDPIIEPDVIEPEINPDDPDDPDDPQDALEPWQKTDDQTSNAVPVGTHVKVKQKLKGRISERDDEIAKLKADIEAMKSSKPIQSDTNLAKRPKEDDFDTDEAYQAATDKYENDIAAARYDRIERQRRTSEANTQAQQAVESAVDSHYDRADKLIKERGISPDVYKQADMNFRAAFEAAKPGQGDMIADNIIKRLGEGSEKVGFFVGINKNEAAKITSLLLSDPSGIELSIYIGQQKERLLNSKKETRSKASKPESQIAGDAASSSKGSALKRKYDQAHKGRDPQLAYNLKKEARKSGADVSGW